MSARVLGLVVVATAVLLVMGASAAVALAWNSHVSKPVLSGTPTMGVAFTVSGFTTPTAKKGVTTVVKIQVLMKMDGDMYAPMDSPMMAKLARRSGAGYTYSLSVTIPMKGDHAVQAIRYANGKVVGKSKITYFTVVDAAQQIAIDSDAHTSATVAAHTPFDVVFHSPTGKMCGAKVAFLTGDFTKTSSDPLTYHCEGLVAGTYTWRCPMTDCCYGDLIVQ